MRRSQVRALLRKARDAALCFNSGTKWKTCPALQMVPLHAPEALWFSHAIAASLLLDGLDVRDVTEAGG